MERHSVTVASVEDDLENIELNYGLPNSESMDKGLYASLRIEDSVDIERKPMIKA